VTWIVGVNSARESGLMTSFWFSEAARVREAT